MLQNAVFAVIFLWVIFSQISNVGVSNYGIKKILPRLIIGALLVNLSFYLCQIAVDLSNILGFSLKEALEGAASKVWYSSNSNWYFQRLSNGWVSISRSRSIYISCRKHTYSFSPNPSIDCSAGHINRSTGCCHIINSDISISICSMASAKY